ncbi:hypothetical protein SLS61_008946 [Didymella pomorum]
MSYPLVDEVYDLLILVDSTYSMLNYVESLQTSLPKVIAISNLTNGFSRIGLLAYRDYSEAEREKDGMLEWSGWCGNDGDPGNGNEASATTQTLTSMAANLEPIGGGDYPEATKTSLARAHQLMRKDATTINAHVFCFLDKMLGSRPLDWGYYTYLSTITRGACFTLTSAAPQSIAQVTIDVLLAWMGVRKEAVENTMAADLMRYKNGKNIKNVKNEQDEVANSYFWATEKKPAGKDVFVNPDMFRAKQRQAQILLLDNNLAKVAVTSSVLEKHLPKRRTSIMDFAKRYAQDAAYKTIVVEQLDDIIKTDVTSMSLNPVFGVLWRAVCNDRKNPARDKLITAFSFYADKIADADEKARLKNWLEESYDYASEIRDCLNKVPDHQSFPCVYLDPTIDFAPARVKGEKFEDDNEHESDPPLSAFRRDELLEIGRSCDGRILKRLGKVLTRITYVESASDLPAHIAVTSNAQVPRIPIALASQERGWKFWKILLHVVLPGTMLAARPAAVLAALAIRIGLKPLFGAASAAMMFWRDKWNNLEVPETWNSSCLGLLLDADAEHRKLTELSDLATGKEGLLTDVDRELFNRLLTYHHAGTNLLTTLTAEIGWTPSKTQVPVGPVVVCRGCKFPRSITIMAEQSGGQCGLCVRTSYESGEHKNRALTTNVSPQDTAATKIAWVECSIQTCRAQYVCYNTADLNVRPKCWYCRAQNSRSIEKRSSDSSPTLECVKCLSKVIWPNEWRHMAAETFQCSACLNGIKTVMSVEINAAQLCKENRQDWLLQSRKGTIEAPFKQTLLKTITATGIASFLENVQVLPELEPATTLTLKGKQILYASVHLQKPACCQHVVDADVTNSSAKAVSMAGMASTDLEPSSTLPPSSVHSVAVHLQRVLSRRTGKAYTLWAT